jgi:hypothetical protein
MIELSLNTHDEYCDMLLTLGAHIIVELVLKQGIHTTLSWSMSYENVLLGLQLRLRETGKSTPTALVNECRPRAVRTPGINMA